MLRFRNKDSLPATPKSWTAPSGYKLSYNSVRQTWEQFIAQVMDYYEQNGLEKPSIAVIEDHICRQISGWACGEEGEVLSRQRKVRQNFNPPLVNTGGGCKSCGGRKP